MASKLRHGSNAVLFTVFTVGILILVNVVASQVFGRVDLTEDQIYTISDASRELVRGLPDRLTVKSFISSDLPPRVQSHALYVRDMLEEYATSSGGKMSWESLDPARDDKIKDEARRLKVPPARLSVYKKDKASVSEAYLGIAFQYGGKVEVIPFVADINNLEYQISSTIRKLVGTKRKVGFTSGHGEPSFFQGLRSAKESIKEVEVTTVDLTEGKTPIPDDIDVLVMVGPKKKLAPRAKYELDQFLMKGKGVAIFMDGMVLETPRGQLQPHMVKPRIARANAIGLREQLEYYGVKLHRDLVMDRQNQRVMLPAGQQRVITHYPAFPVVTDLSREIPITRPIKAYVSVFPSTVEITDAATKDSALTKRVVLARTTERSWRHTGFFLFNPMHQPKPTKTVGPFPLAVYLQGRFRSYFAGKPVPEPGPAGPPTEAPEVPSDGGQRSKPGARLLVVGDAEMVQDQYLGLNPANLMLLQNAIDYLAQDETMIGIRGKSQTRRPLEQVDDDTIAMAKWGNIVGLPGALVLIGVVLWRVRRASRRARAASLMQEERR